MFLEVAKKLILQKFNLPRKLFDIDEWSSEASDNSFIYISSSEDGLSSEWESDCSTDTEQLKARIEREVWASPMLIGGRSVTVEDEQEEIVPGPTTSRQREMSLPSWTRSTSTKRKGGLVHATIHPAQ